MQSSLKDLPGFTTWYEAKQARLRQEPLARFFNEFRRVNQHIGDNLVNAGQTEKGHMKCFFTSIPDILDVPNEDVETACRKYFEIILSLVYDCYVDFGPHIDGHQHYTAEHFASMDKTIENAEEEVGLPRGWTDIGDPDAMAYRWQALRHSVPGCEINHLFLKYLHKIISAPKPLPDYP